MGDLILYLGVTFVGFILGGKVREHKEKFTVNELRTFCETNGVHIYCETDDIVYVNENYICIYAVTAGRKTLDIGRERNIRELFGCTYQDTTNIFTVEMKKGETKLFRLD